MFFSDTQTGKCSSEWQPGGRNFSVLSCWCTVFCIAYQRGGAWTVCVWGVRCLQRCYLPISWPWTSASSVWRAGWLQSFFSLDTVARCSLFLSCLVAEPNQTAMKVQRRDRIIMYNRISSYWCKLNFLSCCRKDRLSWAFFWRVSMWEDHFTTWETGDPRNLKVYTLCCWGLWGQDCRWAPVHCHLHGLERVQLQMVLTTSVVNDH